MYHAVLAFDVDGAHAVLEQLRAEAIPCEWAWTDERGIQSRWWAERLAVPSLGDDVVGWRVGFEASLPGNPPVANEFAQVFVVRGNMLAMVSWLPVGSDLGLEPTESLAQRAARKLEEALR